MISNKEDIATIRDMRSLRNKAHAFDRGYTIDILQEAWDAVKEGNSLLQQLEQCGITTTTLPPHLMDDLMKRYQQMREEEK